MIILEMKIIPFFHFWTTSPVCRERSGIYVVSNYFLGTSLLPDPGEMRGDGFGEEDREGRGSWEGMGGLGREKGEG